MDITLFLLVNPIFEAGEERDRLWEQAKGVDIRLLPPCSLLTLVLSPFPMLLVNPASSFFSASFDGNGRPFSPAFHPLRPHHAEHGPIRSGQKASQARGRQSPC
jgi:hypothetical protein